MPKPKRRRRTAQDTPDEVFGILVPFWVRDEIHARLGELLKAAGDAAIGVKHVYTKDPTTQQWTRVTDPDAIAAFLNRPDAGVRDGWTIYTTDPDVDLLRTLLVFQFGPPFRQPGVPDLAQLLLEDLQTGALVPLGERLHQLRAAPRPSPPPSGLLDKDDRVH
jgi:hypothetical protein